MLVGILVAVQPAASQAQCRLCGETATSSPDSLQSQRKSEKPLRLEIVTNLDFSRLALLDATGGEVSIDPLSGRRQIIGALTDLGGMSLNGKGQLDGEPGRLVRVQMPEKILLSAPNGSTAELVKLDTDLPAQARLDQNGRLDFSFGGKLRVTGKASGQYRGRISITAEYE